MSFLTFEEVLAESKGNNTTLNEGKPSLKNEKNFSVDLVGRFISACSHEEGTNMPIPEAISLASSSKGGTYYTFQYPVYDENKESWFIAEAYFDFNYSSTPIEDGFETLADATKKLKGKRLR